jgi:hypothetical protein
MNRALRKRLNRLQFKKAIESWLVYLDTEKPSGIQTFSWNGSRNMNREQAEYILKKLERKNEQNIPNNSKFNRLSRRQWI